VPLSFRGRAFRPGLLPTLVMLPLLALLLWLGQWQLGRGEEKQSLLAAYAAGGTTPVALPAPAMAKRFQRVTAEGRYRPDRQVLLDNQTHEGRAGYRVLTPLVLADGQALMVDRGWVPLPGNAREQLPEIAVAGTPRVVTGRLDEFRQAAFTPAEVVPPAVQDAAPRVMNYPSGPGVAAATGLAVYPYVLLLDPAAPDGYLRVDAPTLSFGPERHLGYAVQWFGLAAALLILWAVAAFKRPALSTPPPADGSP
jgi:surfeit locus 1 family protein